MKDALFIHRFLALLIDMFIVVTFVSLISNAFVNYDNLKKITDESRVIVDKLKDKEINFNQYMIEYNSLSYQSDRILGGSTIIKIIFMIFYFGVYQFIKGQTIGKKLMKIKIIAVDGSYTLNNILIRSLIINGILFMLIRFSSMLFIDKALYLNSVLSSGIIYILLVIVASAMIMFRKDSRGIHDLVCGTRVVYVGGSEDERV